MEEFLQWLEVHQASFSGLKPIFFEEACYSKSRDCYELLSHVPVLPGTQLLVCYGPHSNAKLFVEYGFVLDDNPLNVIQLTVDDVLRLGNKCSFPITNKHEEILRKASFPCYIYETCDEPSWGVMAAFKVLTMTLDELKNWHTVYNCDSLCEDLLLIKHVKSVLCAFYSEIEEMFKTAPIDQVPVPLKSMVELLWADELRIVKQSIMQLTDLQA